MNEDNEPNRMSVYADDPTQPYRSDEEEDVKDIEEFSDGEDQPAPTKKKPFASSSSTSSIHQQPPNLPVTAPPQTPPVNLNLIHPPTPKSIPPAKPLRVGSMASFPEELTASASMKSIDFRWSVDVSGILDPSAKAEIETIQESINIGLRQSQSQNMGRITAWLFECHNTIQLLFSKICSITDGDQRKSYRTAIANMQIVFERIFKSFWKRNTKISPASPDWVTMFRQYGSDPCSLLLDIQQVIELAGIRQEIEYTQKIYKDPQTCTNELQWMIDHCSLCVKSGKILDAVLLSYMSIKIYWIIAISTAGTTMMNSDRFSKVFEICHPFFLRVAMDIESETDEMLREHKRVFADRNDVPVHRTSEAKEATLSKSAYESRARHQQIESVMGTRGGGNPPLIIPNDANASGGGGGCDLL